MITLHMTDRELNDLSGAEALCQDLRATGESPAARAASSWPVQRTPIRSHLLESSVAQAVSSALVWCEG